MSRRRLTAAQIPSEIPASRRARDVSSFAEDMSKRSASKFGSASADGAEASESAASTFSGYQDIVIESGEAHQGRAEPYWIPHPQDEDECIRDVLFCYRCYDGVRDDRRRGLGMSHGSDRDGRRDSDESGGDYWD